jgi:hypothetical protein
MGPGRAWAALMSALTLDASFDIDREYAQKRYVSKGDLERNCGQPSVTET